MDKKRLLSGIVCAIVFFGSMGLGAWIMLFGEIWPSDKIILYSSLLLAPLCLISGVLGYACWWGSMFILTLISADTDRSGVE